MEKNNTTTLKALYVFSGERRKRFVGVSSKDYSDTQFYGMTHLDDFGIHAEYKEFEEFPFGQIWSAILGFRIKHSMMYFVARKYDVVFGISVLYMLVWKKIFPTDTKFVIFNSVFSRMLTVHKQGSFTLKFLIWLLNDVDGIVFLSHADLQKVATHIPNIKDRLHFVPMGVDATYIQPQYDGREGFFLSVGRDNARDYKTIVEVAKRLPEKEFHFVCLPRNISMISQLPKNVHIHINIPRHELESLYAKAQALLLITHDDSYTDGSDASGPTALLEAMAIGLPVIVSKKAYVYDYVADGVDALLVDFYDSDAIVRSIQAISDGSFRTSLAKHARLMVDSKYSTKEMARGLASVFNTICGKK